MKVPSIILGDDYSYSMIEKWYASEAPYHKLDPSAANSFVRAINPCASGGILSLRLPDSPRVLCFGSHTGAELSPFNISPQRITLCDPIFTERVVNHGSPDIVQLPTTTQGHIDCESSSLDLITCLGVLHHIPTFLL